MPDPVDTPDDAPDEAPLEAVCGGNVPLAAESGISGSAGISGIGGNGVSSCGVSGNAGGTGRLLGTSCTLTPNIGRRAGFTVILIHCTSRSRGAIAMRVRLLMRSPFSSCKGWSMRKPPRSGSSFAWITRIVPWNAAAAFTSARLNSRKPSRRVCPNRSHANRSRS